MKFQIGFTLLMMLNIHAWAAPQSSFYSDQQGFRGSTRDQSGFVSSSGDQQSFSAPARYNFKWDVDAPEENNRYSHEESRDGDRVQGQYIVLLPDGRTQRVVYNVDRNSGYVAEVSYDGQASFTNSGGSFVGRGSGGGFASGFQSSGRQFVDSNTFRGQNDGSTYTDTYV